jgi:peptide-methionine (R)-S-oxide reductase
MDTKQYPVTRTDAEWRKLLTPEQYEIMRQHGTEAPGSCALNFEKRAGTFSCAGCDQPLFVSKRKFESGTGWPSFNDPVRDRWRRRRTAATAWSAPRRTAAAAAAIWVTCFDDGPPPTGLRYCINGVAMKFQPE